MTKRLTPEEAAALPLRVLYARLRRENVEASVALSHPPDCDCELCQRVRARLGMKEGK